MIVGGPSINHNNSKKCNNSSSKKTHLAGSDQILEQLSQIDRLVVVLLFVEEINSSWPAMLLE